jgi:hypothetical protein
MDLTPGEKAVLGQIRVLYYNGAKRDQQVKALLMLWPPTHHGTYKNAFTGLVAKELIRETDSQVFRITDSGLRAMGIAAPQPQPEVRPAVQRTAQAGPKAATVNHASKSVSRIRGALFRLGLVRARG